VMTVHSIDDDFLGHEDADWLEAQFFSQAAHRHHDLDWGPVAPMPQGARRAMHATVAMCAVALMGLLTFVVYAKVIMPTPEPVGSAQPELPPPAAPVRSPNG